MLDEDGNLLDEGDMVRGGENLHWSGLVPVYEGTDDVYPPDDQYDIGIWDDCGNCWQCSPAEAEEFDVGISASGRTDTSGNVHVVNITGIPPECDVSDTTFTLLIDGDPVGFSDPFPDNQSWQTTEDVEAGITVTDTGGGEVDGGSLEVAVSTDNGSTWSNWKQVPSQSLTELHATTTVSLGEGIENLVKWRAADTLGNGPVESTAQRVCVDTGSPVFEGFSPSPSQESPTREVTLGVTIEDTVSGVDASTVEYSVSSDGGKTWGDWETISGLAGSNEVDVEIEYRFSNGSENRVRFRASDMAGNGPVESDVYTVKVNTWSPSGVPIVRLISPPNGSTITTTSVELKWELLSDDVDGVSYDVLFDEVSPPVQKEKESLVSGSYTVDGLEDGTTYFWKVIPKSAEGPGICRSGTWELTLDEDAAVPRVRLISPMDNSTITRQEVELRWEPDGDGSSWRYDVYLSEEDPPTTLYEQGTGETGISASELEDGKTYYWTVLPTSSEGILGVFGETVWSFSVDMGGSGGNVEEGFGVDVGEIDDLDVTQGDARQVRVSLTNLGENTDSFSVSLEAGALAGQISIIGPATYELREGRSTNVTLLITISRDTEPGEYTLSLSVESAGGLGAGLLVADNTSFLVNVMEAEDEDTGGADDNSAISSEIFPWILLVVVLAVIIVFLVLSRARKREPSDGDNAEGNDGRTETVKGDIITTGGSRKPLRATPTSVLDVDAGSKDPDGTVRRFTRPVPPSTSSGDTKTHAGGSITPTSAVSGGGKITPDKLLPKGKEADDSDKIVGDAEELEKELDEMFD